jgi:hypothetical protein
MSPLQLPAHQPELPTPPHSLPLPLVRLSYQSIRHETSSIHQPQPPPTAHCHTSLTSLPRPPNCLTKRSDVDPSLCHDPSIIDHQSANPPRRLANNNKHTHRNSNNEPSPEEQSRCQRTCNASSPSPSQPSSPNPSTNTTSPPSSPSPKKSKSSSASTANSPPKKT